MFVRYPCDSSSCLKTFDFGKLIYQRTKSERLLDEFTLWKFLRWGSSHPNNFDKPLLSLAVRAETALEKHGQLHMGPSNFEVNAFW